MIYLIKKKTAPINTVFEGSRYPFPSEKHLSREANKPASGPEPERKSGLAQGKRIFPDFGIPCKRGRNSSPISGRKGTSWRRGIYNKAGAERMLPGACAKAGRPRRAPGRATRASFFARFRPPPDALRFVGLVPQPLSHRLHHAPDFMDARERLP